MALTQEHRDWLALAMVPGVGTAHFIRLLARFRTPKNVLAASAGALREVVGPKLSQRIAQYGDAADLDDQERRIEEYGVSLVTLNDTLYPAHLAEIYDPPLLFFVRGALVEEDENAVAIVGTRRPSPYGLRMAQKLGAELASRGITVVSGMATGIDAAAHQGALEAGGRTVAVLGCGVDIVYPPQNDALMHEIIQRGCVVSHFLMGVQPSKGHFPNRNRIISGMSLGTVVVQAPLKSGALITAHRAVEQGREIFAVPGEVGMRNSEGPHALLREGAKLVETVEDILLELNLPAEVHAYVGPTSEAAEVTQGAVAEPQSAEASPAAPAAKTPVRPAAPVVVASGAEREVLAVLSPNGSFVDEIADACRLSVSETLSSLTLLEVKGLVRQFSGKRFAPR